MAITAHSGPLGSYGQSSDNNPQVAPSFWYQGDMILDPRTPYTYQPGQGDREPYYGWGTAGQVCIIDQVPAALSAVNIVANAAAPTSGALTLVTASGAGITVGCSLNNALTGAFVPSVLGIDVSAARTFTGTFASGSAKITIASVNALGIQVADQVTLTTTGTLPAPFAVGTIYYVAQINTSAAMSLSATPGGPPIVATSAGSGTQTINVTAPNSYYGTFYSAALPCQPPIIFGQTGVNAGPRLWNPSWASSRAVVITSAGNDSGGTFTVNGFDIYGYPMSQTLAGGNIGAVTTTKAFKYISSVVSAGVSGGNVSVGTADVFGLPLRADMASYLTVYWGAAPPALIAVASVTFVGADITPPSPSSGDVRGTVYGGSASDGTKRLLVFWNANQTNIDNSPVGLLGQQQA
jgi:hypothetical protein